jgi:Zn-dependent M28 family amino/carboxypeptidase
VTFDGQTIEALTLAGSPGGKVSAPAVFVGLADGEGIAGRDLTGKMAVAERGVLNFGVKYENVRVAGAVGLVVVNNRPGSFSGNLATGARIPVVGVSQEDGAAVIEAAKAGQEIGLEAPPTVGLTKALNVIARPSTDSQCVVLVGGHFDTVPSAPGANDNASGTANVIELARALAVDGLDQGICFAAFGAEESGLYGSKALVERLRSEDTLPRYMVNLDVTGIGTGVEVIGDGPLAQAALALAAEAGIPAVPSRLPANSGSDHESFRNAGIETVFFTSGDFSTIHSPADAVADIEAEMLDQIGDVALLVVQDLLAEVAQG